MFFDLPQVFHVELLKFTHSRTVVQVKVSVLDSVWTPSLVLQHPKKAKGRI